MVGKRKRETTVVSRETSDAKESATAARQPQDAQEALRKYFEAHFEPIESLQVANGADSDSETIVSSDNDEGEEEEEEEEDEGEENSEWDGISDDESENTGPEVVDHSIRAPAIEITDKDAKKSFMSSKPPSFSESSNKIRKLTTTEGNGDDAGTDVGNLKNDLALQRLLKESHLLDSASELSPSGKNRHKALDLRIQSAGAKNSIFTQQKMPMSHRKGMSSKAVSREETRRREARENGVILERPTSSVKTGNTKTKRDRGVGNPSIGKFVGGTLHLSKSEVRGLQSSGRGRGGRRGRGGGRGRGR